MIIPFDLSYKKKKNQSINNFFSQLKKKDLALSGNN